MAKTETNSQNFGPPQKQTLSQLFLRSAFPNHLSLIRDGATTQRGRGRSSAIDDQARDRTETGGLFEPRGPLPPRTANLSRYRHGGHR